jgi:Pyruvate/2-oxoacid:ferredoxin oxidoreductase delta subunit
MAEKEKPVFSYRTCMACGICVTACPFGCLELARGGIDSSNKQYPELVRPRHCTGCGICAGECPFCAVVVKAKSA